MYTHIEKNTCLWKRKNTQRVKKSESECEQRKFIRKCRKYRENIPFFK